MKKYRNSGYLPAGVMLMLSLVLTPGAFAGVQAIETEPGHISLAYEAGALRRDSLLVDDTLYTSITLDGHMADNPPGYPAIPVRTLTFAAPVNAQPRIAVSNLEQRTLSGVRVTPVPFLETDQEGFTIERYREDPTQYALSDYRPDGFARLTGGEEYGGVVVWTLVLSPLRYDAHAASALFAESFTLTVTWNGAGAVVTKPLPPSVINRDDFTYAARKPSEDISPFATGDWYKVTFNGSGMYRITGAELSSAGFPTGVAASDDIRMYYGGGRLLDTARTELSTDEFREMAILVRDGADGRFDASDTIVFYGEGISRFVREPGIARPVYQNHPYSQTNTVWITLSGAGGAPKRVQQFGEAENTSLPLQATCRSLRHIEQEIVPELGHGSTIWYWLAVRNESESISFNAPYFVAGDTTRVRISYLNLDNIYEDGGADLHTLSIFVRDKEYPRLEINDVDKQYFDLAYNGELSSTGNIIKMRRISDVHNDAVHLDWVEIDYLRELRLENQQIEFFRNGDGSPFRLSATNVTNQNTHVFETTDPYNVHRHGWTTYDSNTKTLRFQASLADGETARYTIWGESAYRTVESVNRKTVAVLRTPSADTNYIIVSHPDFLTDARRLADWRSRDSLEEPLTPLVVNVEDIYDSFSWGVMDPTAIRNYLQYVWEHGDPDRNYYCLLFGDTINKYKNLSGNQPDQNLIPTHAMYDFNGALVTDDFFTWVTTGTMAPYAIGRLCVNDVDAARMLVDKIIRYESDPEPGRWHNRIFLVADDEYGSGNRELVHTRDIESLDTGRGSTQFLPDTLEREKLLMIEYPMKNGEKPEATQSFLQAFNKGFVAGTYVGHGNKGLLAHEHLFVGDRDIAYLDNGERLPVFGIFSCTTADFIQPDNVSLAEMLNLREGGGCVGVVAASGETYSHTNAPLNEMFFLNLFDREANPEMRIGRAMQLAKNMNDNTNKRRYLVLGDPATRLMAPRYDISTSSIDSLALLQKLELEGSITNGAVPASYGASKLYVTAHGPRIQRSYTTNHSNMVNYTLPGVVFYNGEYDLSGDTFDMSLMVPKDLGGGDEDTIIRFFATTGDPGIPEAAGVISDFRIAGLDANAPDDLTGPGISLSFDGKPFEEGDFISRQPIMKASFSDPSGINVIGRRGHNITLTIDDAETVILTDRYRALNGYTSGGLDFSLPTLPPGEHTLEISVYDSYNNAARKRVRASVVGSETGELVISDLLNWPNPMGYNGTTFTFNLTDDARNAEIKVYSQAGRLVDSTRFTAGYGFNQHYWTPPFTLANGVYFYKLTVSSVNGRKASKIEKLVVMK